MRAYIIALTIFIVFQSCKSTEEKLYSPEFKEDVEELNLIRNEKNLELFLFRLDSCFNQVAHKRPLDWYEYYNFRAWYCRSQADQNKAIRYTDSMLLVITPYQDIESYYVHALTQKGFLLQEANLFNEALTEFYKASSYADRYLSHCEGAEIYYNLGLLLYQQKKFEDCQKYYRIARQYASECDSTDFAKFFYPTQGAYNAEGLCFEKMGQLDSAKILYEEGIAFIDRYGKLYANFGFSTTARAVVEGNLGNVELILGHYDRAEELLKKSINVSLELDYVYNDAVYSQLKLGKLYLIRKDFAAYQEIVSKVENELEKFPFLEGYQRLYALQKECALLQGDSVKAFLFQEHANIYKDSMLAVVNDLSSLNVQTTLSYMQQREDLIDLKGQNERKLVFLIVVAIGLLFLGVILYQYRRNLKTSWNHAKELAAVNEELKANNEQLVATMEALEGSQAENARIMKIVAHDLRSPIIGIHSIADLIKENAVWDKESKEGIAMIYRISKDSLRFMDDLLNMHGNFRIEEKINTDLLELVDYSVNFLQLRADDKKQNLQVQGGHVFAPVYRERLWRVIINLISNAIKFSPEGVKIEIELSETETHAKLAVRDQGVGIPEKMKKQIFDVMGDVKRMGTAGERSFGLGLAISLEIMEAHNGRIWFESEENAGSSFFIEVPKK